MGLVLTAATSNLVAYYESNHFRPCKKSVVRLKDVFVTGIMGENYLMYADLATILGV